ncbi:SAC3 domain-containing protein 1 [Rhinatrema bivittatum]|uniref:SAC3 domain-containing protein 1 n=1 Tax=Rhinatrema bivittatum TaxID=194408 RepID=UPI0011298129|nr:SAC3 domain-containing protein 1 [Rhinatrema bivittatum]XP_029469299.1 SAC3 domain-containing protein 1 [Rhinatrema bivittatum]
MDSIHDMNASNPFPVGTCLTMCPEQERMERELQHRLHRFEMLAGTEGHRQPQADPHKTVKEYSRPAAGKNVPQPTDLRPPAVLLKTVRYLMEEVVPRTDASWRELYTFVSDRLRSVRQDMIVQRVHGEDCVTLLEPTLAFLLCAGYCVSQEASKLHHFDSTLHAGHMRECFSWLLQCYKAGIPGREAEFQALFLLYDLGSPEAICHSLLLPPCIRGSSEVQAAMAVNWAYLEGNYVRFFRLLRGLSFLQSVAVHRHVATFRSNALRVLSHGYSCRDCRFPLELLTRLLAMDNEEQTTKLCQDHGLTTTQGAVTFRKAAFRDLPGPPVHGPSHELVDRKMEGLTLPDIINGKCS